MNDLLIHPKTKKQLANFLRKPTNSMLITGEVGSGKLALGEELTRIVLKLRPGTTLSDFAYYTHIQKDQGKKEISIEKIRQLISSLMLKTPGKAEYRRIVLIEDSQNMSLEAQSALLKVLEEPNNDTMFILTAPSEQALLPTIVSRCLRVQVYPVSIEQAELFFGSTYSSQKIESAWRLSQGRVGLLRALLVGDEDNPLRQAVQKAKDFLKAPNAERVLSLEQISKDKEEFGLFLEALSRVIGALYQLALEKNSSRTKGLLADRRTIQIATDSFRKNANSRLVNLKLLTNISV